MSLRAPLAVVAVPKHRMRAGLTWAAILIGGPLVCLLASRILVAVVASSPDTQYAAQIFLNVGVNATLAVSLCLINGFTGQFSLGHAGFMAIGAYSAAALMYYGGPQVIGETPGDIAWGIYFSFTLVLSGLVAAIAGLGVGLPSLRLKGDYLAIVTLGFGEIIRVILLNMESMRGARGFSDLAKLDRPFFVLLVLLACVFVVRNLVASTRGLGFLAVRDDEIAAESVGVNTTRYKVSAFVVGAFFAGVAGGLYAHTEAYIIPGAFDFVKSMEIVAMVVLGGLGSIRGAILAAAGLTLLPELLRGGLMPEFLRDTIAYVWTAVHSVLPSTVQEAIPDSVWQFLPRWRMVIYSLILIAAMLIQSRGKAFRKRKSDG